MYNNINVLGIRKHHTELYIYLNKRKNERRKKMKEKKKERERKKWREKEKIKRQEHETKKVIVSKNIRFQGLIHINVNICFTILQ